MLIGVVVIITNEEHSFVVAKLSNVLVHPLQRRNKPHLPNHPSHEKKSP